MALPAGAVTGKLRVWSGHDAEAERLAYAKLSDA